jgi:hypothetical protein
MSVSVTRSCSLNTETETDVLTFAHFIEFDLPASFGKHDSRKGPDKTTPNDHDRKRLIRCHFC